MKASLRYLIPVFLCIWLFIAMYSCMPCSHCHALQSTTFIQGASCNNDDLCEFNLFSNKPVEIPLARKGLHEISGIAASLKYTGVLYLHEDNGHCNHLYLTNEKGEDLGRLTVAGSYNRDWEDIAVGPGPSPEHSYIYIADIGDNHAWRRTLQIYRLPEPVLNMHATVRKIVKGTEVITLQYPDKAHNAETILLDPFTRDLYIATKEDDSCRIYVARYPQSTHRKITLEYIITLPFRLVTSGNIASNGREILLRNEDLYWHWERAQHETVETALKKTPQQIVPEIKEPQGEAICFTPDQHSYLTCSEVPRKQAPAIYLYKKESTATALLLHK